jgi:hypothetical protein
VARGITSFIVPYSSFAPPGLSRTGDAREAFEQAAKEWVRAAKDAELAHGLDRHGEPLAPISATTRRHRRSWTRHADPSAPSLPPAYGMSRTRALLDVRADQTGVWVFWRSETSTGREWRTILSYHARGLVCGAPRRDVISLAPESLCTVQAQATDWWRAYRRAGQMRVEAPGPVSIPLAGTRPR